MFAAAWGEFRLSLEDLTMLTSLQGDGHVPLFGAQHSTKVTLSGGDQKKVEFLSKSLSMSKYLTNKETYLLWEKYFKEGKGRNSQFKIEAILAYWLSYFVFPSQLEDGLHSYVFPLVVLLPRGTDWH